jgi:hypothetical protein
MGKDQHQVYMFDTIRMNAYTRVALKLKNNTYPNEMRYKELAKVVAAEVSDEIASAKLEELALRNNIYQELPRQAHNQMSVDDAVESNKAKDKEMVELIVSRVASRLT